MAPGWRWWPTRVRGGLLIVSRQQRALEEGPGIDTPVPRAPHRGVAVGGLHRVVLQRHDSRSREFPELMSQSIEASLPLRHQRRSLMSLARAKI